MVECKAANGTPIGGMSVRLSVSHGALYSRLVRLVAGLIVFAFTILVSVDKICCPDGCTDGSDRPVSTESAPHHVTHTCVLCVGVDAPIISMPAKPSSAVSTVTVALTPALPSGAPDRVDHPPRGI